MRMPASVSGPAVQQQGVVTPVISRATVLASPSQLQYIKPGVLMQTPQGLHLVNSGQGPVLLGKSTPRFQSISNVAAASAASASALHNHTMAVACGGVSTTTLSTVKGTSVKVAPQLSTFVSRTQAINNVSIVSARLGTVRGVAPQVVGRLVTSPAVRQFVPVGRTSTVAAPMRGGQVLPQRVVQGMRYLTPQSTSISTPVRRAVASSGGQRSQESKVIRLRKPQSGASNLANASQLLVVKNANGSYYVPRVLNSTNSAIRLGKQIVMHARTPGPHTTIGAQAIPVAANIAIASDPTVTAGDGGTQANTSGADTIVSLGSLTGSSTDGTTATAAPHN